MRKSNLRRKLVLLFLAAAVFLPFNVGCPALIMVFQALAQILGGVVGIGGTALSTVGNVLGTVGAGIAGIGMARNGAQVAQAVPVAAGAAGTLGGGTGVTPNLGTQPGLGTAPTPAGGGQTGIATNLPTRTGTTPAPTSNTGLGSGTLAGVPTQVVNGTTVFDPRINGTQIVNNPGRTDRIATIDTRIPNLGVNSGVLADPNRVGTPDPYAGLLNRPINPNLTFPTNSNINSTIQIGNTAPAAPAAPQFSPPRLTPSGPVMFGPDGRILTGAGT